MTKVCSVTRSFCNFFHVGSLPGCQATSGEFVPRASPAGSSSWPCCLPDGAFELAARSLHGTGRLRIAAQASGHQHRTEEIDPGVRQRPSSVELYESVFMQLLEKCQAETATRSRRKFRFKNKLMSLDAASSNCRRPCSTGQVPAAQGRDQTTLLLDHDGYLPRSQCDRRKYSELRVARSLRLEVVRSWPSIAATTITRVRAVDTDGVFFVTRMKANTSTRPWRSVRFQTMATYSATRSSLCLPEQGWRRTILFRRIEYWNADKQEIWCSSPIFCIWRLRQ